MLKLPVGKLCQSDSLGGKKTDFFGGHSNIKYYSINKIFFFIKQP